MMHLALHETVLFRSGVWYTYFSHVFKAPLAGTLYYHAIMPQLVQEYDGYTPYWPGSPFGGGDDSASSMREGDYHDWHVWHDYPLKEKGKPISLPQKPTPEAVSFLRYAQDMARFVSEFGMHASPVAETLRRVIPADQHYHHSPSIDHHNKDNPKNKGDLLMSSVTGVPQTLEELIDFSMLTQAEGAQERSERFLSLIRGEPSHQRCFLSPGGNK